MDYQLAVVGKKNYSLIGRVLCKIRPDVASQIEKLIAPGEETELRRIFFYYSRFHAIYLPGYNNVNKRRLFIASMLKFYHPKSLESGILNIRKGFCKNIAACFMAKQESVTRNIREVIVLYRAYEDFEQKVNEIVESFKTQINGSGGN